MDVNEKALELHKQWNGKLTTEAKSPVKTREDLSQAHIHITASLEIQGL